MSLFTKLKVSDLELVTATFNSLKGVQDFTTCISLGHSHIVAVVQVCHTGSRKGKVARKKDVKRGDSYQFGVTLRVVSRASGITEKCGTLVKKTGYTKYSAYLKSLIPEALEAVAAINDRLGMQQKKLPAAASNLGKLTKAQLIQLLSK